MKLNVALLTLLWTTISFGQTNETLTIPKGVVYKYADPALVEKAKSLVKEAIETNQYPLSQEILIVGPTLWQRFDKIKALHAIEGGHTTFLVDNKELKGKMTQNLKDSQHVWDELRKEVKGNSYNIRKLTPDELRYYWSVISFDIEEPIFIVECNSHTYILNLVKTDLKLMWLDEVPQP